MTDIARKAFAPHELKLDESGTISVAFAQLDVVDKDADVSLPGSFPAKSVPMSAYGHTSWDGALPIGKGAISEAGGWAVLNGQFLMDTDQGRNAYNTVKAMADLQEWSYGYNPLDYSYGQKDGQNVRFLKSQDVYEVSPVLRGAGVNTHTLAIKSGRPEADAPYAELLSWYSDGLSDLRDRVKDRAVFRAKEGRVLSAANLATLDQLAASLEEHTSAIRELMALASPPPKADPALQALAQAAEIENLLAIARANGVAIG